MEGLGWAWRGMGGARRGLSHYNCLSLNNKAEAKKNCELLTSICVPFKKVAKDISSMDFIFSISLLLL